MLFCRLCHWVFTNLWFLFTLLCSSIFCLLPLEYFYHAVHNSCFPFNFLHFLFGFLSQWQMRAWQHLEGNNIFVYTNKLHSSNLSVFQRTWVCFAFLWSADTHKIAHYMHQWSDMVQQISFSFEIFLHIWLSE